MSEQYQSPLPNYSTPPINPLPDNFNQNQTITNQSNKQQKNLLILILLLTVFAGLSFALVWQNTQKKQSNTELVIDTDSSSRSTSNNSDQDTPAENLANCLATTDNEADCQYNPLQLQLPPLSPTPQPHAIPHGKTSFSVSGGAKEAPQVGDGYLDPYDPAMNQNQVISLQISSPTTPVTKISVLIETDNKKNSIPMYLIQGNDRNGTWQGTWQVNDTYLYTYNAIIEAQNSQDTQKITITLR